MNLTDFKKNYLKAIFVTILLFVFMTKEIFSDNEDLFQIKSYLNNIKSLQAEFSQTSSSGDNLTGSLFLKKPWKIRFSYNPPSNLQIVSKQKAILIFDPKSSGSGPLSYPLSSTPLEFLLNDKLDSFKLKKPSQFEKDNSFFVEIISSQFLITIELKKNPLALIGWVVDNEVGEKIYISLNNMQINNYISDQIFKTDGDYERIKKLQ